jgi:general secretion pathway protein N
MRPGSLAILGIAAYSMFLVAGMPARWLAARIEGAAPGRYQVHEADGTLWKGSAKALLTAPGGTLVIDRAEWDFLPSRLLQGRLAFAVSLRGAGFEAKYEAGRSFGGWGLRDLALRADAALAAAALPLIARWRPEGSVAATAPAIDVAGNDIRGNLRIEWKSAATTLSAVKPLGSYRAEVVGEGPSGRIALTTLEGPLRLSGQGRVEWPARFTFTGEARAEGANPKALEPLMEILGPAKPDGARALEWQLR